MSKSDFTTLPILDYKLLSKPSTRETFILQLRHALIFVGFFYLANPPVSPELVTSLIDYVPKLFALPQEKKDRIRMANSEQFLGYSRLGEERTRGATDQREQFDFATEYKGEGVKIGEPEWKRLMGEPQWPDEADLPGFKQTLTEYFTRLADLSYEFNGFLAEALGLPPNGLDAFFEDPDKIQHRGKIVRYPTPTTFSNQGVGPHFDGGFLTLLLQASNHPGLQVQSLSGAWIDMPPLPNTLVVNFGKGLEVATRGLARATSHRVLSPPIGSTPRYSIPFFQRTKQRIFLTDHIPEFPPEVMRLKEERGELSQTESINYAEYERLPSGLVELFGRVRSHPDVGQRHYPALFKQLFPTSIPSQGRPLQSKL